jgi:hypothetical protein
LGWICSGNNAANPRGLSLADQHVDKDLAKVARKAGKDAEPPARD